MLLIANDITADSRVLRYARALTSFGLRVTVLGISSDVEGSELMVDGAHVVRVRVPLPITDAKNRSVWRRLSTAWRFGYHSRGDAVAARTRWWVASRELAAEEGRRLALEEAQGPAAVDDRAFVIERGLRRRALRAWRKWIWLREGLLNRRQRRQSRGTLRGPVRAGLLRAFLSAPVAARWESVAPQLLDYEFTLGPALDELEADVIHVHDVYLMGVADRAVARARAEGRRCSWVYDAREYVAGLPNPPARVVAAYADHEAQYIRRAARVVTVCEPIAEALRTKFSLTRKPDLVLNAPIIEHARPGEETPSVRAAAGVADGVPLLVYSGGLARPRGVHTVVQALPQLPGVHLAVVSRADSSYTKELERIAERLGVADRLHLVPFVDTHLVVDYLSTATAGIIPLLHEGLNHDWALTNKFFEYLQGGLPVITSDVEVQTALVREHGIGEAFVAGDPDDCARVVQQVLDDLDTYRKNLSDERLRYEFSWDAQTEVLRGIYRDLLGALPSDAARAGGHREGGEVLLGIGPTNSAGQGWAWARAAERHLQGVRAHNLVLEGTDGPFAFPADQRVPREDWFSASWQAVRRAEVAEGCTHALVESGQAFLGGRRGIPDEGTLLADLADLRRLGVRTSVVFHGSEVRLPSRHLELEPSSVFRYVPRDLRETLEEIALRNQRLVRAMHEWDPDLPCFVSTPDLLDYVPGATWLPVVVDLDEFRPGGPVLEAARPVVVHVPSNPLLKGSQVVDAVLGGFADRGLIDYRRAEGVPSVRMPELLAGADVVVDQVGLGLYGVQAAQAMAAGRVVLGQVGQAIRSRVPADLPILEATSSTLPQVLEQVLADRDAAREVAARGRDWVRATHDGRLSAAALAPFLGVATRRD